MTKESFEKCRLWWNKGTVAKEVSLPKEYVNDLLPYGDRDPDDIQVESVKEQDRKLNELLKKAEKEGFTREDIVVISCDPNGRKSVYEKYYRQK